MERTDDELKRAFDAAPKAIQDALSDGPAIDFMVGLQPRYSLHIDAAGLVVARIRDLLLGLSSPTEFLGELINLGVSDTVARTLVADLNKEVFVPLQQQMRNPAPESEAAPTVVPEPPVTSPAPTYKPEPLPVPAVEYEPAPPARTLPGSNVPVPAPTIPSEAVIASVPVQLEPTPVVVPTQHMVHAMPTSGGQPGWHPAAAVHIFVPTHGPQVMQASTAPQPPIQPVSAAPIPEPVYVGPEPAFVPPPPAITADPEPVATPLTKDYAADPYREPL